MPTYSLIDDFGGVICDDQLHREILESSITQTLAGINRSGDVVDIIFETSLSVEEETTLDALVAAHVPAAYIGRNITNITVVNDYVNKSIYVTLATFNFQGTDTMQNVTNIKVIGSMDEGGTSYDVRVCDMTNIKDICEVTLTNTDETIQDLGTISNLPQKESVFQLQAKIDGTSIASIKNINFYHD